MKIDGKNYQVSKPAQEIFLGEFGADKKGKIKKVFNIFDNEGGVADGKLSQSEIQNALNTIVDWSKLKKDDDKLSRREIRRAFKNNPELKDLSKKELRKFISAFLALNEQKVLAEEAKAKDAPKAEESKTVNKDSSQISASEHKAVEEKTKTYDYVVPEGQSFKALMKKVLLVQGKKEEELTDEDYAKAEEQFRADNPDVKIRGNKTKYLLAGEKVKVSVDFGEELLDPKAEEAKWAKRVEARRQAREKVRAEKENQPDPKVVEEAKSKGMRPTDNKNFFYNDAEKMHYRYKDGKFIKYPNIKLIRKDGTYVREYKNADGSSKVYDYSKDGYPTSVQGRNFKGQAYLNEKKQAQVLGLKDTYATNNKHIYYDPKTKMHFKWNDEKKRFDAIDKDARYVSPDGSWGNSTPPKIVTVRNKKTGEVKTRTEHTAGYEYTYDANGNYIKSKEPNGSSKEYGYDSNNNWVKTTNKDKAGNITRTYEYTNSDGERTKVIIKDKDGNILGSRELIDNEWVYKDASGKIIQEEEYNKI